MSKASSLKGSVFEWFVRRILVSCGFIRVKPDDLIVYNGPAGLMIHGIGQSHNADVLMHPPIQIPFYFQSRLLVECKAHGSRVGLPIVRNVFGLREDINNFELLTPQILQQRRNYRRKNPASFDYERYQYQVALATIKGLKNTALEFAITHKIPILSFHGAPRYAFLRDFINSINKDYCDSLGDNYYILKEFFKRNGHFRDNIDFENEHLLSFLGRSYELFRHMYVGVTENGNVLFLYSDNIDYHPSRYEMESTIHWRSEQNEWWITARGERRNDDNSFYFELPKKIYDDWSKKEFDKKEALEIKERNFSRISVFKIVHGRLIFFTLKLNMEFIQERREELNNDL